MQERRATNQLPGSNVTEKYNTTVQKKHTMTDHSKSLHKPTWLDFETLTVHVRSKTDVIDIFEFLPFIAFADGV